MKIIIRADANPSIGMGHIMRCLSIADAAFDFGHKVKFITAGEKAATLVQGRGYEATVLDTDYRDMDSELNRWPDTAADFIIVDSYYVTQSYLSSLMQRCRLVYIDDAAAFAYPVDILVNYNAYGEAIDYRGLYSRSGIDIPKLVLGPAFAPLRSMFRDVGQHAQPKEVKHILFSTGGSDELHLTSALIRYIINSNAYDRISLQRGRKANFIFHFLIGAMNKDQAAVHALSAGQNNIILHESVTDMRSLIEPMDLAVSAAGSTLYEIASCGVPLVTYSLADNQLPGAAAFASLGLAVNIGDLRQPSSTDYGSSSAAHLGIQEAAGDNEPAKPAMGGKLLLGLAPDKIMAAVKELASDYGKRKAMGSKMQALIDGYGASRLVEIIMGCV